MIGFTKAINGNILKSKIFIIELTDTIRHLFIILGSNIFAFSIGILAAPLIIDALTKLKIAKQMRECSLDGKAASLFQKLHLKKTGTPTMGGILIWGTTLFIMLFGHVLYLLDLTDKSLINRNETYLPLFTLISTALLGAIDDYFNIKGIGKQKGLSAKPKLFWLTFFAILGAYWFYFKLGINEIFIPFVGHIYIGPWYIPLFIFIILASANAVNFTDGLDGLAGGLTIIAFSALAVISYAQSLLILTAFCTIIIGATLAFLWFNIPPAKFYMGDTGALSLGATLGVIAMLTDSVAVFPLIMFVFVIETLSVIIQLLSKKFRGKKIFHIAPLHHHFEHVGWPESQITMRFWIVGAFIAGLGLILRLTELGI